MDYDVIVIGAGVVGMAIAETLSKVGMSAAVIERNRSFGMETSSRNSEVIHAGIYYPKDSLKARLCVPGNRSIYEWCDKYNVPHNRIGKYIVAVNEDELEELENIYKRGKDNGVEGLEHTTLERLRAEEPNVIGKGALWSRDTGIVDTHKLTESIAQSASENKCDFAYKHNVISIEQVAGGYSLSINSSDGDEFKITAARIVNSAGLDSDKVAAMAGIDTNNTNLHYCKGHYFRVSASKGKLVKHLIYPVPPKHGAGLGIHVTLDLAGGLKLGPDTIYMDERIQDYSVPEALRQKFYDSVSKYIIGIEPDDIYPDQSGIRPKLQGKGEGFRDFIIREESEAGFKNFVNLIGIESPGLTSCFEIAQMVKDLFT